MAACYHAVLCLFVAVKTRAPTFRKSPKWNRYNHAEKELAKDKSNKLKDATWIDECVRIDEHGNSEMIQPGSFLDSVSSPFLATVRVPPRETTEDSWLFSIACKVKYKVRLLLTKLTGTHDTTNAAERMPPTLVATDGNGPRLLQTIKTGENNPNAPINHKLQVACTNNTQTKVTLLTSADTCLFDTVEATNDKMSVSDNDRTQKLQNVSEMQLKPIATENTNISSTAEVCGNNNGAAEKVERKINDEFESLTAVIAMSAEKTKARATDFIEMQETMTSINLFPPDVQTITPDVICETKYTFPVPATVNIPRRTCQHLRKDKNNAPTDLLSQRDAWETQSKTKKESWVLSENARLLEANVAHPSATKSSQLCLKETGPFSSKTDLSNTEYHTRSQKEAPYRKTKSVPSTSIQLKMKEAGTPPEKICLKTTSTIEKHTATKSSPFSEDPGQTFCLVSADTTTKKKDVPVVPEAMVLLDKNTKNRKHEDVAAAALDLPNKTNQNGQNDDVWAADGKLIQPNKINQIGVLNSVASEEFVLQDNTSPIGTKADTLPAIRKVILPDRTNQIKQNQITSPNPGTEVLQDKTNWNNKKGKSASEKILTDTSNRTRKPPPSLPGSVVCRTNQNRQEEKTPTGNKTRSTSYQNITPIDGKMVQKQRTQVIKKEYTTMSAEKSVPSAIQNHINTTKSAAPAGGAFVTTAKDSHSKQEEAMSTASKEGIQNEQKPSSGRKACVADNHNPSKMQSTTPYLNLNKKQTTVNRTFPGQSIKSPKLHGTEKRGAVSTVKKAALPGKSFLTKHTDKTPRVERKDETTPIRTIEKRNATENPPSPGGSDDSAKQVVSGPAVTERTIATSAKEKSYKTVGRSITGRRPLAKRDPHHGTAMSMNSTSGGTNLVKKQFDDCVTQPAVATFAEVMKSVGSVVAFSRVIGTAFRVGSKYVMTASHIVRSIVDPLKRNIEARDKLTEAFVNFAADPTEPSSDLIYNFLPNIPYNNENLDVAILELNLHAERVPPPPLHLSRRPVVYLGLEKVSLVGFGHPRSNSKHLEIRCSFVPKYSDQVKNAKSWIQSQLESYTAAIRRDGRQVPPLNSAYRSIDLPFNMAFSCFMEHGGSGSPVISTQYFPPIMEVVGVYTHGLPSFFFDLTSTHQANFPTKWRFEIATDIGNSVFPDLRAYNKDLFVEIFGM